MSGQKLEKMTLTEDELETECSIELAITRWMAARVQFHRDASPDQDDAYVSRWLAARKDAALHIDPATAEVTWIMVLTLDPYGIGLSLPEELEQIGREYFARSPGGDIWVWFGDLPDATRNALWDKIESQFGYSIGGLLEVRTTRCRSAGLIIYAHDRDKHAFVLICREDDGTYHPVGWATGSDVKKANPLFDATSGVLPFYSATRH